MPRIGTSIADLAAPARGLLVVGLCCLLVGGVFAQEPASEPAWLSEDQSPTTEPRIESVNAEITASEITASEITASEITASEITASEAETQQDDQLSGTLSEFAFEQAESWVTPQRMGSSAQVVVTMVVLGLVPALLLMTTSYVRVVVVLGLLRQAFGAQQMLPAQVTTAIAMFITVLVMWPTWEHVYHDAIEPYAAESSEMTLEEAWQAAEKPIRAFMSQQIKSNQNCDDVRLFMRYLPDVKTLPEDYDDVPLRALLPAFMLSELKTAFLIGFGIYLPFLIIDLFVSAVTTSMGMFMLPPAMISMPLKLLLFVLVDGWNLVVGMLLESFQSFG